MKKIQRLLAGLILLCIGTSCRQEPAESEDGKSAAENAEATSGSKESIKIGCIFSISGPASFLGAPEARTARMLAEQINAEGGINGHSIELIIKDSGGSSEKAMSFAKQLIDEDNVLAILGPATSGETLQIKSLCEQNQVILMSCAAAEVIVNPVADYVFKTAQKDSQAITLIYRAMKDLGITRIGIISGNTGFGKAGKKQLEDMAPEAGIEIVISEVYDAAARDLTDILSKVKAANVEAVVNWSIVPAQSIVPKNMKQIGFDVPLFQSHGFGNLKYAEQVGEAGEGIIFPASRLLVVAQLADDHPQKAILTQYKESYESRYNEDVSAFGGYAHDALAIVAEGVRQAGTSRAEVREAIENLKGFIGVTGEFNFSPEDHNGLGLDAFEMLTVKDSKFVLYKAQN